MRALTFNGGLQVDTEARMPEIDRGWARVRVRRAGICRTDLELTRGYMGFAGILGHEFVGDVEACDDSSWSGTRVVGEINAACGACEMCNNDLGRHCPARKVLGISGLGGALADYCAVPLANLHRVPASLSDEVATFCEPVSAAHEILEQISVSPDDRVTVLGDGKLGILCAWALAGASRHVTLLGQHPHKLAIARKVAQLATTTDPESLDRADIVVEATGRQGGLAQAIGLCRPRGTLILKSTIAINGELNLAPIVIDEITVVGSRCGRFQTGLRALSGKGFPVQALIEATYSIADGIEAFEHAQRPGALKIIVSMDR